MRVSLTELKARLGDRLTGATVGVVSAVTAEKISAAVAVGRTVHVGSRNIGDCIKLRAAGRMLALVNSRKHGLCERAIYLSNKA